MRARETRVGKSLIVAGGTGGHIFPALAFGAWLLENGRAEQAVYVSGSRALEREIYASWNLEPRRLPLEGSPLGTSSWRRNLGRWVGLVGSLFTMLGILRRERPEVCFLFGSYVSWPALLCCRLLGVPAVMHVQNARAGKVTRLASRIGVAIASGWAECRGVKTFTPVGVPVRRMQRVSRQEALRALDLQDLQQDGETTFVGVIGGSLSSASLTALVEKLPAARKTVFLVLGDPGTQAAVPKVRFLGKRWDMAPFYALCDAVICRAGASTLAELAAYGIPALAVPWLGAADGHQEANARAFSALTANPVWFESEDRGLEEVFQKLLDAPGPKIPSEACEKLWDLACGVLI